MRRSDIAASAVIAMPQSSRACGRCGVLQGRAMRANATCHGNRFRRSGGCSGALPQIVRSGHRAWTPGLCSTARGQCCILYKSMIFQMDPTYRGKCTGKATASTGSVAPSKPASHAHGPQMSHFPCPNHGPRASFGLPTRRAQDVHGRIIQSSDVAARLSPRRTQRPTVTPATEQWSKHHGSAMNAAALVRPCNGKATIGRHAPQ